MPFSIFLVPSLTASLALLQVLKGLPGYLENRKTKGASLATSSLGSHQNIAPSKHQWNCLCLNICWQRPSHLIHSCPKLRHHPKLLKSSHLPSSRPLFLGLQVFSSEKTPPKPPQFM